MRLQANGVTLHVQEMGAGPPLVMIHGLLVGSLASWYFTAAPKLARSHRVLLYDLRGHGASQRVASGYDLATMAADLRGLLDRWRAGPVSLVGHSYGALVALRLALDEPHRVARLGLVEAPLPPGRIEEMRSFVGGRTALEMAAALPAALRASLGGGGRRAARAVEGLAFLAGSTSLLADLAAEPDLADGDLARLRCPALCVYGEDSSCRPVGDRLARVMPGARLVVLPGGHYLPVENPAALTRELIEFLGAPARSAAAPEVHHG